MRPDLYIGVVTKNIQRCCWVFFLCLTFFVAPNVSAKVNDPIVNDRTWLRLLEVEPSTMSAKTAVTGSTFLLASAKNWTPQAELSSTLTALQVDPNVACRFPARALYLSSKGLVPEPDFAQRCPGFTSWLARNADSSIDLLFVAEYLGNPASAFGHSLLRINNGVDAVPRNLLDQGINFGAAVPPGDSIFTYIVKGITGGYVGAFSQSDFYTHDHSYSRSDARDMWGYSLNISDFRKKLFIAHLWEVRDQTFTYYFFKQNCAYRLGLMAELMLDVQLVRPNDQWLAPVTLFHRLSDEDAKAGGALISAIGMTSSLQREINERFLALNPQQKDAANALFVDRLLAESAVKGLPTLDQPQVLDLLLMRHSAEMDAEGQEEKFNGYYFSLLTQRLALPPSQVWVSGSSSELPTKAHKVGRHGISIIESQQRPDVQLRWTAFSNDLIGSRGLRYSSFNVFDLKIDVPYREHPSIRSLTMFGVERLPTKGIGLAGESRLAWRGSVGWRDRGLAGNRRSGGGYLDAGIGGSLVHTSWGYGYVLLDASISSSYGNTSVAPALGAVLGSTKFQLRGEVARLFSLTSTEEKVRTVSKVEAAWTLVDNLELRLDASGTSSWNVGLGLFRYF
jgi:hypothetical protein